MNFLLAVLLAGTSAAGVEYRVLDAETAFRPLDRTSLLHGSVEFRVRAPEGSVARSLRVLEVSLAARGGETTLCESPAAESSCVARFSDIARRALRVEYEYVAPGHEARRVSTSVETLHAHPDPEASRGGHVAIEYARTRDTPPDHVIRTIRFESVSGSGDRRRVQYHSDIREADLEVKVRGMRGAKIVSLSPPDPGAPKVIPILFDAAPYLVKKKRRGGMAWGDSYVTRVRELRQGLRKAAEAGVDVEFFVVSYGADSRLYGPFRLHPGRLDERERRDNEGTLDELERTLRRAPEPEFENGDFGSVVHTLSDLYLRGHPGIVQFVWLTDGWSEGGTPRFQPDLWPERVVQLNPEWSEHDRVQVLTALDAGLGLQDAELSRLLASMSPDEPDREGRILRLLQTLDPDATRTLHPHRIETSPMMNCMFVPSDRSLRGDRFTAFREFVERGWGGDLVRFLRLNKSKAEELEEELSRRRRAPGAKTIAGLLQATAEQMAHTGRIELEVPNPDQNGAQREIVVKVRRDGVRARLMPLYTASRPRDKRLADFMGSPFKSLRVLAAHECRHHPFDDALREAVRQRWAVETDPQVLAVVFESWISIQLQLLQAGEHSQGAYEALVSAGRQAERLPLPGLAREAAAAAEWSRGRLSD